MTSSDTVSPDVASTTPAIIRSLERKQAAHILAEELAALPERWREAVLVFSDGGSYPQIGELLGVSTQRAHEIVQGALAEIRRCLRMRCIQSTADLLDGGHTSARVRATTKARAALPERLAA